MPCLPGTSESQKLPFKIFSGHCGEIIHFAAYKQHRESYVTILFQGGRKKFITRTPKLWKPKTGPTLILSEKQLKVWNQRFPAETAAED